MYLVESVFKGGPAVMRWMWRRVKLLIPAWQPVAAVRDVAWRVRLRMLAPAAGSTLLLLCGGGLHLCCLPSGHATRHPGPALQAQHSPAPTHNQAPTYRHRTSCMASL